MKQSSSRTLQRALSTVLFASALVLAACGGSDGKDGSEGAQGATGAMGPQGPEGPTGPEGAQGPAGAPGHPSLYGDGSAGPLVVGDPDNPPISVDWVKDPPSGYPFNNQFTDCTIHALQWRVPSGLVLKCTGTFTAQGILVSTIDPADGGSGPSPVVNPRFAPGTGAVAATGLDAISAAETLYKPLQPQDGKLGHDEGQGASLRQAIDSTDSAAGGEIRIYAGGAIDVSDVLAGGTQAGSNSTNGGGGGGLIALLSGTSITIGSGGVIEAQGGAGASSQLIGTPIGGGGGGGVVHLIAPTITVDGTINVNGGVPGTCISGCNAGFSLHENDMGGAGGASVGGGGHGMAANGAAANPNPSVAGGAGRIFQLEADPEDVVDVRRLPH